MSADNGIYILRTVRNFKEESKGHFTRDKPYYVYRVAYASAIDNFDYYETKQPYNLGAYMKAVWGSSAVFLEEKLALEYAQSVARKYPVLEYGINLLATDYIFYGDL